MAMLCMSAQTQEYIELWLQIPSVQIYQYRDKCSTIDVPLFCETIYTKIFVGQQLQNEIANNSDIKSYLNRIRTAALTA